MGPEWGGTVGLTHAQSLKQVINAEANSLLFRFFRVAP
jgi:hypothetical protein